MGRVRAPTNGKGGDSCPFIMDATLQCHTVIGWHLLILANNAVPFEPKRRSETNTSTQMMASSNSYRDSVLSYIDTVLSNLGESMIMLSVSLSAMRGFMQVRWMSESAISKLM